MNFRKAFALIASTILLSGAAQADPIAIDIVTSYDDSSVAAPHVACHGLSCAIEVSLSESLDGESFSLNVGESYDIDFFDVQVWAKFAVGQVSIEAVLALVTPDFSFGGSGDGIFGSFFGHIVAGALLWDHQPEPVDLGDGTFLQVSFQNLMGLTESGATNTVHATFSRYSAPVSVPEPGALGLLGLGLLTMALVGRRKRVIAS